MKTAQLLKMTENTPPIMGLDDELARLKAMNKDLTAFRKDFDRILTQRDDLLKLVADLTRERDSLRNALQQRDRQN